MTRILRFTSFPRSTTMTGNMTKAKDFTFKVSDPRTKDLLDSYAKVFSAYEALSQAVKNPDLREHTDMKGLKRRLVVRTEAALQHLEVSKIDEEPVEADRPNKMTRVFVKDPVTPARLVSPAQLVSPPHQPSRSKTAPAQTGAPVTVHPPAPTSTQAPRTRHAPAIVSTIGQSLAAIDLNSQHTSTAAASVRKPVHKTRVIDIETESEGESDAESEAGTVFTVDSTETDAVYYSDGDDDNIEVMNLHDDDDEQEEEEEAEDLELDEEDTIDDDVHALAKYLASDDCHWNDPGRSQYIDWIKFAAKNPRRDNRGWRKFYHNRREDIDGLSELYCKSRRGKRD